MIEVPAISNVSLSRRSFDLYAYLVSLLGLLHRFSIDFDASDSSNLQAILVRKTQRGANTQLTAQHITPEDHWILLPKDAVAVDLQHHGEDRFCPRVCLLGLQHLGHVGPEPLLEVVNNVCRENLHAIGFSLLPRFRTHLHVEGKNHRVLRVFLFRHDHGLLHVLLVYLTNAHVEDGDLHVLQEGQQSFQRTKGARLHIDSLRLLVVIQQDAVEALLHIRLQLFDVIVGSDHQKIRPSHGGVQTRGADLDAHGFVDALVMHILGFDAYLLHWMWC
mmetsp:Transcript_39728/g.105177  ORF Transcript_39728/g.105177 Transcript_39728/m.105177 type:complete len:275 (-) Transcript_39728:3170-3994(-)